MVLLVGRQPKFYVVNVAFPVFFFVPMAMLQFCVLRDQPDARLSVSLAIVLTAVAHKYTISSLVPAISYLTFIDKYVLSSLCLIVIITFQGGCLGYVEGTYCRMQAVFNDDLDGGADAAAQPLRRLVAAGGGRAAGGSTSETSTATAEQRLPLYYLDADCPFAAAGPFNKFDFIDLGCFACDLILWILLQLWAWLYYCRVRGAFDRRVQEITIRQVADRLQAELREHTIRAKKSMDGTWLRRKSTKFATRRLSRVGNSSPPAAREPKETVKAKPALTKSKTDLKNWNHIPGGSRDRIDEISDAVDRGDTDEANTTEAIAKSSQAPLPSLSPLLPPNPPGAAGSRPERPAPTLRWQTSAQRVLANCADDRQTTGSSRTNGGMGSLAAIAQAAITPTAPPSSHRARYSTYSSPRAPPGIVATPKGPPPHAHAPG